jgi:hypothetical protein
MIDGIRNYCLSADPIDFGSKGIEFQKRLFPGFPAPPFVITLSDFFLQCYG